LPFESVPIAKVSRRRASPAYVRPRIERVPTIHDPRPVRGGQSAESEARREFVERFRVQAVQIPPRHVAATDAIHRRHVGAAPRIDERVPIARDAAPLAERVQVAGDARAPIDERPEHVENERTHRRRHAAVRPGHYAVTMLAAAPRPISAIEVSRILNFCTLPETVIGNSLTKRT
jgi:hypothetical protein